MGEGLTTSQLDSQHEGGYSPEDAITEDQQAEFVEAVGFWSGALDSTEAAGAASTSGTATIDYMRTFAPHREVTGLVHDRTSASAAVRHQRGGVTITCRSTDDFASMLVESRQQQADSELDRITRTEYVVDGPDTDVVDHEWLIDRGSGERVEADPDGDNLDDYLTFGDGHTADITLPETTGDAPTFTQGRYKEVQRVFATLAEEGWQRSSVR